MNAGGHVAAVVDCQRIKNALNFSMPCVSVCVSLQYFPHFEVNIASYVRNFLTVVHNSTIDRHFGHCLLSQFYVVLFLNMSSIITLAEITDFNRFVKYYVIIRLLIPLRLVILVFDILPFDVSGCEPVIPHFSVRSRL